MNYYQDLLLNVKTLIIYLRKSREDVEYELKTNNYDTLQRHKARLLSYAFELGFKENQIVFFEEVLSGDSIADRPEFQKVLLEIETPNHAVLVIDVQRLTRGGYSDQGKVIDTFKYTHTLIITPDKIFDLTNKADEEYFADKLNFSRKEYEHIKRRLTDGRKDSIKEGKYVGSICAYGYERYKLLNEKGYSLRIVPEKAEIVRLIFKKCLEGVGTHATATYLNSLNISSPKGSKWLKNGIREMLHNETYCGYVKWQQRRTIRVVENGILRNKIVRSKKDEYLLIKGKHEPIISEEEFEYVQEKLKSCSTKYIKEDKELLNPLAGILRCSKCDLVMARRLGGGTYWTPKKGENRILHHYPANPIVVCTNKKSCGTVSHNLVSVEDLLIETLKAWLYENKKIIKKYDNNSDKLLNKVLNELEVIEKAIDNEQQKLTRIMNFLEDGTYDRQTYNNRSAAIKTTLEQLQKSKLEINKNNEQIKIEKIKSLIPLVENCVKIYHNSDVRRKNELLHSILYKVTYNKTIAREKNDLMLDLYVRI